MLRDKPLTAAEVLQLLATEAAKVRKEDEELGLPERLPGLRPIYAIADKQPNDGGLHFTVAVTGEDFGGPARLPVRLTPDALRDPFVVTSAFGFARVNLLRVISARFAGQELSGTGS